MQHAFRSRFFDCLRSKLAPGEIPVAIAIPEIADLALGFLFRIAMPHLHAARKLVAPAGVHAGIIVGKLAPLLFQFPAELLQAAFDSIPVHVHLPALPDWVCVHRGCVQRVYIHDGRRYHAHQAAIVPPARPGVCAVGYTSGRPQTRSRAVLRDIRFMLVSAHMSPGIHANLATIGQCSCL
jgi:hypothetical protein